MNFNGINMQPVNPQMNPALMGSSVQGSEPLDDIHGIQDIDHGFKNMSIEELLAYCQIQMDDIDNELRLRMANQQKLNKDRSVLSQAQNVLESYDDPTVQDAEKIVSDLKKVIEDSGLPPNDPARRKIEKTIKQLESKIPSNMGELKEKAKRADVNILKQGGVMEAMEAMEARAQLEVPIGKADYAQLSGEIKNAVDDIKDESTMRMLSLQSLVSKRQTAIQLITNMISKFNQSALSIANNVKG